MERLAREKIATQQRLAELKNELSQWMDVIEIDRVLRQTVQPEEDQASTSTASGRLTVREGLLQSGPYRNIKNIFKVMLFLCKFVIVFDWQTKKQRQTIYFFSLFIFFKI